MAFRKSRMAREAELKNENVQSEKVVMKEGQPYERLLFGVDSKVRADDLLQNNLTEFEWVERNKMYPAFWIRNIDGENCLTREEIKFIHGKACKIAVTCSGVGNQNEAPSGRKSAEEALKMAHELDIPGDTAIFLEVDELVSTDFMFEFASRILEGGYTPGFKANTDAKFGFDREFSRGMQTSKDVFEKCLVWATAPSLKEFDRVTTTHFIHPDNWIPFAPSAITRKDIAIWQYGKECHPIHDDAGKETFFNVDLVLNELVIIEKMY